MPRLSKLISGVPGSICKSSAMCPELRDVFGRCMSATYIEDHLTTDDLYNKYASKMKRTSDYCMFLGVIGYKYIVIPFRSDKEGYTQLVIFRKN